MNADTLPEEQLFLFRRMLKLDSVQHFCCNMSKLLQLPVATVTEEFKNIKNVCERNKQ